MVSVIILSVVDHGFRLVSSNGQHDHLECGRSWVQPLVVMVKSVIMLILSVVDHGYEPRSSLTSNGQRDHLECGRSWVQTTVE